MYLNENIDIYILGCGNILWGDDGFGPAVIEHLKKNYQFSEKICVENAGLSIRGILFDILLSEKKPKKIIIIDATDKGKKPGEIFKIPIDEIPKNKTDDFSMHQAPTSNLLKELKDNSDVDIIIISCQIESITDRVKLGLSKTLLNAIPEISEEILKLLPENYYTKI